MANPRAQAQADGALGTGALAGGFQPAAWLRHLGLQCGGHGIGVVQHDLVGGGVVECRHEMGANRNLDPQAAQVFAHGRGVEQVGQHAGVDLAGLATAGAAVKAAGVRVVKALAAVAGQQHQWREGAHQPHGMQLALGHGSAGGRVVGGLRQAGAQRGGHDIGFRFEVLEACRRQVRQVRPDGCGFRTTRGPTLSRRTSR